VVHGEPDAERFLAAPQSDAVTMSAVSLTEASIVAEARQGPDAGRDFELLALGTSALGHEVAGWTRARGNRADARLVALQAAAALNRWCAVVCDPRTSRVGLSSDEERSPA
jgi:uncharacterized protein with PIN domain